MKRGDPWNERAQAYRESAPHVAGPDLDLLVEWAGAGAGRTALDVGSGGGHLARRLREAGFAVTTADPAAGMHPDVICRAEELPFPVASFDLVASRLAFHHFSSIELALAEAARVTNDVFLLEDMLYVDDRVEAAETLRDPSHGRCHSLDQWGELISAAGLELEATEVIERPVSFVAWLERCNCTGEAAERARELLSHRLNGDSYTNTLFLLKAVKPR